VASLVAVGAATLYPVSRRLKRRIDSFFARDRASPDANIEALQQLRRRVHGDGSRDQVLDAAFVAMGLLRAARAELWTLDEEAGCYIRERWSEEPDGGRPSSVALDSELGRDLAAGQLAGVPALAPRGLAPRAALQLFSLDLAMVATFSHAGQVGGFLAVGRRLSGTAYSMNEIGLLGTIAAEVGVTLGAHGDGRVIGRYRLDRRLGVGGMAEVFLARQLGPGGFERKVAVKRPLPAVAEDPRSIARFLDEARIAARLHHDNIVQIYEVGVEDGSYFIVMEYVDGFTLRQLIAQAAASELRPPVAVAVAIIDQILDALEHVHTRTGDDGEPSGLIHRDVTPRNVLMSASGAVKLVDFGIARAFDRMVRTQTGAVPGTLAYMSPEQAAAGEIDQRTDLYSAACVAYELFSGNRAHRKHGLPPPLTALRPEVPAALSDAIARGLARDPDERFASARELSDALRAGLGRPPAVRREVAAWVQAVASAIEQTNQRRALDSADDKPARRAGGQRAPSSSATQPTRSIGES
jgi:hypothetical protein